MSEEPESKTLTILPESIPDEKTPPQMDHGQLIILVVKRLHQLEEKVLDLEMGSLNTSKALKTLSKIAWFVAAVSGMDIAITLWRAYMLVSK